MIFALGLGYANLGSVLMMSGLPYESEQAYAVTGCVSADYDCRIISYQR